MSPFVKVLKLSYHSIVPLIQKTRSRYAHCFHCRKKGSLSSSILDNNVIPAELAAGLRQAQRTRAVREFEAMLNQNLLEWRWQKWFEMNSWVLGSQFVRILDQRSIDTQNISDFLMQTYDGFLDIVEIKQYRGQSSKFQKVKRRISQPANKPVSLRSQVIRSPVGRWKLGGGEDSACNRLKSVIKGAPRLNFVMIFDGKFGSNQIALATANIP